MDKDIVRVWNAARLKEFKKSYTDAAEDSAAFDFNGVLVSKLFAKDLIEYLESITAAAIQTRVCPGCKCRIERRGSPKSGKVWSCQGCRSNVPPATR